MYQCARENQPSAIQYLQTVASQRRHCKKHLFDVFGILNTDEKRLSGIAMETNDRFNMVARSKVLTCYEMGHTTRSTKR